MHTNNGLPVRISSPGCSDRKSPSVRSARMSDVILVYASCRRLAAVGGAAASAVVVPPPLLAPLPLAVALLAVVEVFVFGALPVRCMV